MFNPLAHFGVDSKVLSELNGKVPKVDTRTMLLDGDGCCYTAAANVVRETTAVKRLKEAILTHMYRASCDNAVVHLTPSGCFKNGRHLLNTAKPYQANRAGTKNKPRHLEYLRSQAVADIIMHDCPEIKIYLHWDIEADDALVIDHYKHPDWILVSPDKDLLLSPYPQYIVDDGKIEALVEGDTFGWIDRKHWFTPRGVATSKMVGKGTKFFMAQLLMGDTADNVKGINRLHGKLCGEVTTYEVLKDITTADEAANFTIEAYQACKQNVVAEAEAMWLLRDRRDSGYKFLSSLDLTPLNREYLDECFNGDWKLNIEDSYHDNI